MGKVVIIGIDGGTFDIINPLVAQGKLPNIEYLIKNGASGRLKTTIPPMTFPAWSSFMTGVNPGKHGVFDFTERIFGSYQIRFLNAKARKAKTMWKLASEAGKRVCVMAVPVTYPPEEINGYMISGFDAPGVDARANYESVYPPQLLDEINKNVGEYIISSNIMRQVEAKDYDGALDVVLYTLQRKIDTSLYLYKKEPWDIFCVVFGESDLVGHHYWKFYDPKSPFRPEGPISEKCIKAVETVYMKIDNAIGRFLESLYPETTLILMSDHGFGGSGDKEIYLNSWLAQNGFLKFKEDQLKIKNIIREKVIFKALSFMKKYGLKWVPAEIKRFLFRHRPEIINAIESSLRFKYIDWSKTYAFSEETPYYPTIWINLKGREPQGIVDEKDKDKLVSEIIECLKEWREPETNLPVVRRVFRKEEIYSGPYVKKAPDIIIDYNEPGGYSFLSRNSFSNPTKIPLRKVSKKELESSLFQNKSGSHRNYGILFMYGNNIKQNFEITNAKITDIAPTVFYCTELPIPSEFDGKTLIECFNTDETEFNIVSQTTVTEGDTTDKEIYSKEEEEEIKKRLKGLGYL